MRRELSPYSGAMSDQGPTDSARPSDRPSARWSVRRVPVASLLGRLAEVTLAAIGLWYALFTDSDHAQVRLLGWWDAIAVSYLLVGFWVLRRARREDEQIAVPTIDGGARPTPTWHITLHRRFSFLITVVASLNGIGAATDVIVHGGHGEEDAGVRAVCVIAVFCAWTLLHAGYAAFYRYLDTGNDRPGLRFPDEAHPNAVDYLYFAITLGVSFAVSDVEVVLRRTRWHVLVHQVVSFFYNAAVLAIAISVVTGR